MLADLLAGNAAPGARRTPVDSAAAPTGAASNITGLKLIKMALPSFFSRKSSATSDAPLAANAATLYLCRHGETTHNAGGILQGHLDTSLNATGRGQAEALGAELRVRADAGLRFCSTVYSSDLGRACDTAKASMRALGGEDGFTLSTTPQLRERGLGRFEGRTPAESKGADIDSWRRFQRGQTVEGVEDTHALEKRVVVALRAIAAAHPGEHVLVFSHGGTIGSGLEQLLPGCARRPLRQLRPHSFGLLTALLPVRAPQAPSTSHHQLFHLQRVDRAA